MRLLKNIRLSVLWRYLIYISISSIVTSGLNILHTKYILQIEPRFVLFIVPILAGVIFGYLLARLKSGAAVNTLPGEAWIYLKYILMSCFVTAVLNVVHTEWVLHIKLEGPLFIAPLVAGIFFGYLLARIKVLNNRLSKLATTDSLTGAYNRLYFDKIIEIERIRINRYGGTFSILYFDIDNFKSINDEYGHMFGDHVLVDLVNTIQDQNRKPDILIRYGGEEFVILATNTNIQGAQFHAERLRKHIMSQNIMGLEQLSCSFGVSEYCTDNEDSSEVVRRADNALTQAKKNGKNRVEIDTSSEKPTLFMQAAAAI